MRSVIPSVFIGILLGLVTGVSDAKPEGATIWKTRISEKTIYVEKHTSTFSIDPVLLHAQVFLILKICDVKLTDPVQSRGFIG